MNEEGDSGEEDSLPEFETPVHVVGCTTELEAGFDVHVVVIVEHFCAQGSRCGYIAGGNVFQD